MSVRNANWLISNSKIKKITRMVRFENIKNEALFTWHPRCCQRLFYLLTRILKKCFLPARSIICISSISRAVTISSKRSNLRPLM